MKKVKLTLPVLILSLFLAASCNDSGGDSTTTTTTTTKDTTATADTIKSDPSTFSQPH